MLEGVAANNNDGVGVRDPHVPGEEGRVIVMSVSCWVEYECALSHNINVLYSTIRQDPNLCSLYLLPDEYGVCKHPT